MKTFRMASAAALLFLVPWSASLRAEPITQIVSFGDSLSDVGNTYAQYNYPASPPYAAGRYSNGPIWLDHLASKFGVAAPTSSLNGGSNYAWGGAATDTPAGFPVAGYAPLVTPALALIGPVPNVNTQIAAYLAKNAPSPHTLYTLWAGANDFFDGQTDPTKPADNLKADILTLISKGAKNFLVANLPALGETPLGRAQGSKVQVGLDTLTGYFNSELNADLKAIQAAHPEVQIHLLDAYGLFQSVEANPAAFGFSDITDPAVLAPGVDPNQFLFWDDVHPTAAAGVIIGDAAAKAVGTPEPSAVVLLLTGGAGLLGCGRRLRKIVRPRAFVAVAPLLAACLIAGSPPCRAQTPPPSAAVGDASAGMDALAPAPEAAPAESLLRHFKFDETWLAGENPRGLGIDDVESNATVALPLGGDLPPLLLTPGVGAHFWTAPRQGVTLRPELPADLYDAYLEVDWRPKLAEWLYADLAVTPGLYSDFKEVNYRSFQPRGRGLAVVAFSPYLQVVFGAIYVNYNRTKILPAGGLIWDPTDDLKLQMCFPQPKLARRIGDWGGFEWWAYVAGEFGGGRWSVERADGEIDSVDYTDARALLGTEWLARGGLGGHAEVGYVFDRRVTSTGGVPDYTPDGTVLVRAGMRF